jgi:antitoxin (DNA-binding transcriptional repressor) of toxin-antitoxin stability system
MLLVILKSMSNVATITTKELRSEMSRVVGDLKRGKSYTLNYRRKAVAQLQPVGHNRVRMRRGSPEAIAEFLRRDKPFGEIPERLRRSDESVKDQIKRMRDEDIR